MTLQRKILSLLLAIAIALGTASGAHAAEKFAFGRFGETQVYKPAVVRHVAIYFSDDQGFSSADDALARALADQGMLVAGIDLRHYAAELAKPRDKCSYLAGEFEDFSHELQKHFSPQRYHMPVLIGVGRAAELVYGVTAQGSSGTFIGMVTLGFKPQWMPLIKLCQSYELRYKMNKNGTALMQPSPQLSTPWIAIHASRAKTWNAKDLQRFIGTVGTAKTVILDDDESVFAKPEALRTALVSSAQELVRPDREPKVLADELRDLPLEEVRATGPATSRMAIFLTGDGGWAEIDKGVSAQLAKSGVDVIALSSLQYFWKPRSPDETAKDVARVLRHYLAAWNKQDVLIVGYSFGADVAPFIVNRLPDELRNTIRSVSLLGLAETADFEVHVTTWLGVDHHGLPIKPEMDRLKERVLCVYGEGEKDTLCTSLKGQNMTLAKIGDGHHFGDRYDELAQKILQLAMVH